MLSLSIVLTPTLTPDTSLTCGSVKGLYQDAGCCSTNDANVLVDTCNDIKVSDMVDVPANINYDSMAVRYDVKAQIANDAAMNELYTQSHLLASEDSRYSGCSFVCWRDTSFFQTPTVKAAIAANFTGLHIPESNSTIDSLIGIKYLHFLNESRRGAEWALKPISCEEEAILTSPEFKNAFSSLSGYVDYEGSDTLDFPSTGAYIQCDTGHVRPIFTGFDTIMDGEYLDGHVYVSGGGRTLDRFKDTDMSYDAKPVTTIYAREDPMYPPGSYLRYEMMWPMNGGVRPSVAGHDDHICMSGVVGPLYGYYNWGPNSDWEDYDAYVQLTGHSDYKKENVHHLGVACWHKDYASGDAPVKTYHLYDDDFRVLLKQLGNSAIKYNRPAMQQQFNIRDTDMDSENIYINLMLGGGNTISSIVIRFHRESGQVFVSDFAQPTISNRTSVDKGARAFHMSVDDQFVHILQNTDTASQNKILIKYPKNFINGEKPIGLRDIGQDDGYFSNQAWINTAGFFGSNPIASFGSKVYFPARGMFVANNDYTFANASTGQGVKQIAFPASRPWRIGKEFFDNSDKYTSDGKVSSIVYGCVTSDTHVFFSYGMARNFDVMRSDQNRFDGDDSGILKDVHAHHKEWVIFKVDPTTDTVVDVIEVVTEQASGSECFVVDRKGEYGYIGAGDNNRETTIAPFNFIIGLTPWGLVHKVRLSSGTKSVRADGAISPSSSSSSLHLEGGTTRTMTMDYDGLHMRSSGNKVENIRIKGSELGIAHMDNTKRNVYLGSNIGNMGIPQISAKPDAKQEDNIIIGTKSGNMMHGMSRNIIIGNNIENVPRNPDLSEWTMLKAGKLGKYGLRADEGYDYQVSSDAQFALGMHSKLLLSGNLDHQVLNIPGIDSLKKLKQKINADELINADNAVFVKNNIVQVVNKNNKIDGVQYLIDQMTLLSNRICALENPSSPESCVVQQRTSFTMDVRMGQRVGTERFSLSIKQGNNWSPILSWDGSNVFVLDVFDVSYTNEVPVRFLEPIRPPFPYNGTQYADEYGSQGMDGFRFSGKIFPGTYKLVVSDTREDGWGNDDGIGPGPTMRNHHGAVFNGGNANAELKMGVTYQKPSNQEGNPWGTDPQIIAAMEIVGHDLTEAQQKYQETIFQVEGVYCTDEVTVMMQDVYGDGWNGNYLEMNGNQFQVEQSDEKTVVSHTECFQSLTNGCSYVDVYNVPDYSKNSDPWGTWFAEVIVTVKSEEFGIYKLENQPNTGPSKRILLCPTGTSAIDIPFPGDDHKKI